MTDHATHRATRHEDGTKGRVRKAVLPVGGLGTRFLPFSKACPKEMLPILDKPLVQYAVEEAAAAGITQIVFVTASAKRMIEDHFDAAGELERTLRRNGRHDLLASIALPEGLRFAAVRQPEPRGLGDAVLRAREIIGDPPGDLAREAEREMQVVDVDPLRARDRHLERSEQIRDLLRQRNRGEKPWHQVSSGVITDKSANRN